MKWRIIVLAVALCGCAMAPADPVGAWGGDHISMIIGEGGAEIEFDCAQGRIDGAFNVGAGGVFNLAGVWSPEHGGPVRQGEEVEIRPARYTGKIVGNTMTLSIAVDSPPADLGPFTLKKNRAPNLLKCL
jgi:hypothetical protein